MKEQELQEVLKFPFEIRSFSFLNSLDYGTLNPKNQNYQIRQYDIIVSGFS